MTGRSEPDETVVTVIRTIPVPTSVSPEAQRALAAGAAGAQSAAAPNPARDDIEGWRAYVRMAR